uniref:Uncharacterized protein n=1 Tax=Picea glauca TaxID=3330 RepID=A0A101M3Z0_PICGL|nr:hypothetical protein ABT39_MTgene503 [Picea glauca]
MRHEAMRLEPNEGDMRNKLFRRRRERKEINMMFPLQYSVCNHPSRRRCRKAACLLREGKSVITYIMISLFLYDILY